MKKKRKTLSKMNIAQSINFSIPSPQQGHKQLRVLIVGTLPLTYFTLIHNFFPISYFGEVVCGDLTKLDFIFKLP